MCCTGEDQRQLPLGVNPNSVPALQRGRGRNSSSSHKVKGMAGQDKKIKAIFSNEIQFEIQKNKINHLAITHSVLSRLYF